MKRILILISTLTLSQLVFSQDKSLDISFNTGIYSTPSFEKAQTGHNYSADFDYHLKNSWIISSGFNFGKFRYFESVLSNEPNSSVDQNGTNAEVSDRQVSIKLKKDLFKEGKFNIRVGTGFTILTETQTYPYSFGNGRYGVAQSTFTDLAFPISVEPYFHVYSRFYLGLKAEMYIEPDFPVMGFNIGPQLRVRL